MRRTAGACLATLLLATPLRADVVDAAPGGFSIRIVTEVNAAPAAVFRALGEVGSWWNSDHTWSGSASNMSMDLRAGGCFCEKLPAGGVQHMTVSFVDAPKTLRLNGGLGPMAALAVAGSMTWTLTEKAGKTELGLSYNVAGYMPGGLNSLAPVVNQVVAEQITRLKSFVETGRPK